METRPRYFKYYPVELVKFDKEPVFDVACTDTVSSLERFAYNAPKKKQKNTRNFGG